jgi:hypothetical protein
VSHLLLVVSLALQEPQRPAPPPPPPPQAAAQEALRVYLDCGRCDLDFLRTEITFVDYVRDRHDAQVYLLVSTQRTGAGGTEYTLTFIGQAEFEGRADTLRYVSRPAEPDDAVRHGLAHILALGLARYVAHTPLAEEVEVRRRQPGPGQGGAPGLRGQPHDPWNYWVFRLSGTASLSGEASYKSTSLYNTISANRVTDRWKVNLTASANTNSNKYQVSDTSWYTQKTHSYSFSGLLVRSLGSHWSAGLKTGATSSTYYNRDWNVSAGPALEYDLWPYSESTRRLLRFNYSLNVEHAKYDTLTVYQKTAETLVNHSLEVALTSVQRWGTTNVSLTGTQYLRDLSLYDYGVFGGFTLNLVRGLSFNGFFSYSRIHDQLYLKAANATPDQILTRQVQLPTSYSYYTFVGLSYTFGSIYNNIVNPRFGSRGGSGMMISF